MEIHCSRHLRLSAAVHGGGENVNKDDIKRILEEQLQLLSEHSKNGDPSYLGELTESMVKVVNLLRES